jgi:hypothetical protein
VETGMSIQGLGRSFLIMLATAIAAGAAFYLLQAHWTHALGLAPYLLFLACPLMHLFMHNGHKHSGRMTEQKQHRKDIGAA